MKKYRYSKALLAIALLALPAAMFAAEATKEYHKEFTATSATTLGINSKYGNVVIESWDKDQIVIDVKVKAEAGSQERAETILSYIDITFSESGDIITAKTEFNTNANNIHNGLLNRIGNDMSIDYTVKMPVNTALNLENRYGNTVINELGGLVNLSIKYGNLTAGKLTRGNEKPWSTITLGYGRGTIEEAGWLTLNTSYVGMLDITQCHAALLTSKYSKINFVEVSSIVGECKYDNLSIGGSITNLDINCKYTDTRINRLTNILKFNGRYGSLSVDDVPAGFDTIDVDVSYLNTKLEIANDASYELNGQARYGGIRYDSDLFTVKQRIQENNSLTIAGVMGKDTSPASKVRIAASYSNVTLNP
ncbi:MAG: hypothetical protein LBV26_06605 [Bacteroidales bacterium]|jgi:hypothetical protein|nr:hypothetical protein [Bacteroidales bacterium]